MRSCEPMVVRCRSMAAVARVTAVENPMQYSVECTSLSIVLGMPITFTPRWPSCAADFSVPSPPMAMSASMPMRSRFLSTWSVRSKVMPPLPSVAVTVWPCRCEGRWRTLEGPTRVECSTVPPVRSMVRVFSRFSGMTYLAVLAGSSRLTWVRPSKPRRMPTVSAPFSHARCTTLLMTEFNPGTSPPPVRMPIRVFRTRPS